MEHIHENMQGLQYYWEYIKRFGKESSETWWKDFIYAILPTIILVFIAWGDRTVLEGALLTIDAIALLFGVIALRHMVHTSLILFRERAHPEYGGIRYTHWGYGVWGAGILLGLALAASYGAFDVWTRKPPSVVFEMPAPLTPTINAPVTGPGGGGAASQARSARPTAPISVPAAATPKDTAGQRPIQTPPQTAQSPPPATFLDRVVQENRALTPDDRNRLSTELYEADQFVEQSRAVGYKLNAEFGRLGNERQSGALAKDVDDHIKLLRDLDTPAWDQYHGLQRFQDKWKYFPDQTAYIFGDNPFNAGEGLLINTEEGMANSLTWWSKISNRDQRDILNIEAQPLEDFEKQLRQFFDWAQGTMERIKQMRQSLDPNGVVEPIPSNATAPAPAMFLDLTRASAKLRACEARMPRVKPRFAAGGWRTVENL